MTPEEDAEYHAAHKALEQAIEKFVEVSDGERGLITGWTLATSEHLMDEDGEGTANGVYSRFNQPIHVTMGQLRAAQIKTDNRFYNSQVEPKNEN